MEQFQQTRHHKSFLIIKIIAAILIFAVGIGVGIAYDVKNEILSDDGQVEITKVINLYNNTRSPEVDFSQYWEIWDKIKEKYVSQPVDEVDLFYSSIKGLVEGLDDPHSIYFPPAKAKEFAQDLQGKFEGIGAEIGMRDEILTIIAPLPGSPAEAAGLKSKDKILKINDEETFNMSLDEAVRKIRGEKGTEVVLTITRNGLKTAKEVRILRDTINVPTVIHEMKESNIAYLRIGYFNNTTMSEFDKAVKKILLKTPAGIILDLRSNPGGYLDASVEVASEWIETGVIVRERFNDDKIDEYVSQGRHRLAGIPTVVLVDDGTASGSEIVAGALQDHGAAKVVGVKTYGKGSVQDFEFLRDGSALKLTVAKWFTPNDRQIDGEGIEPDIVLEKMFAEDENGEVVLENDKPVDYGLQKAIELLTN